MKLKIETSERSERTNPVMPYLVKYGFYMISYEGFTIKNNMVSAVLDKFVIEELNIEDINDNELFKKIIEFHEEKRWKEKIEIANLLKVPFFVVIYSYPIKKILICRVNDSENIKKEIEFSNLNDFSTWLYQFRDMVMSSPYEEKGLPLFDKELRKINRPWPGNLDCVLAINGEGIIAIIEFQTTIKFSVKDHCNNMVFKPSRFRKGDEQRWLVMDIIQRQLKKPLIIIVWSPKENDNDIKVKKVKNIIYSWDNSNETIGLHYSTKEIIRIKDLPETIKKLSE